MRLGSLFSLLGCLLLLGCVSGPEEIGRSEALPEEGKLIVTPQTSGVGSISLVNENARYVVISLGLGQSAYSGQVLSVYRKGLKVGELKVTGPQEANLTAADIVSGNLRNGDLVLRN